MKFEKVIASPMRLMQIHVFLYSIAVFYVIALTLVSADNVILQKGSDRNLLDSEQYPNDEAPQKRPFCNAFKGCGKKRSDDSMRTLYEYDSQPAIDKLRRKILSEVRLWEALQKAKADIERRQRDKENIISLDSPLGLAIPNYRKKRSIIKNYNSQKE